MKDDDDPEPPPTPEPTDEEQAEFRRKYIEQIRRQQCPGCGDTDIV